MSTCACPEPVTPLKRELHGLYQDAGLLTNDGRDCPSYPKCSASCRLEGRTIAAPTGAYVGEAYEEDRILFVGINTNDGSESSKTFYDCYHWISHEGTEASNYVDGATHRITRKLLGQPDLSSGETRRHFAFTNLIKCSVNVQAGTPTEAMQDNCEVRHGFLFQELGILKPQFIVALGAQPFTAIRSHYADTVAPIHPPFKDWLFSYALGTSQVVVCFAYNPGQGYRSPRAAWKNIREKGRMAARWKPFLPAGCSSARDLEARVSAKYQRGPWVDLANPFYELILDELIGAANAWKDGRLPHG